MKVKHLQLGPYAIGLCGPLVGLLASSLLDMGYVVVAISNLKGSPNYTSEEVTGLFQASARSHGLLEGVAGSVLVFALLLAFYNMGFFQSKRPGRILAWVGAAPILVLGLLSVLKLFQPNSVNPGVLAVMLVPIGATVLLMGFRKSYGTSLTPQLNREILAFAFLLPLIQVIFFIFVVLFHMASPFSPKEMAQVNLGTLFFLTGFFSIWSLILSMRVAKAFVAPSVR